jgi:putative ABC transport system ATP-binding protein
MPAAAEHAQRDGAAGRPLLVARALAKQYGDRSVLADIDLRIEAGERLVVIGRSGSGKSTLLHMLAGLDTPTSGQVWLEGVDLTDLDESGRARLRRHSMGFVFQFFNLIPTLTVAENVRLPLSLNGIRDREASNSAAALLDDLGLGSLEHRLPEELSGGEQQRVAIARAVIHRPRIVFADEPTGNLDLETASQVVALLERVCRRDCCALVMATHAREVVGMADRTLAIRNGRIEETTL